MNSAPLEHPEDWVNQGGTLDRRTFIKKAMVAADSSLMGMSILSCQTTFEAMTYETISTEIDGLRIHALCCGQVRVKRAHRGPSPGAPAILLDPFWTEWLPIWVWVVEHPEGLMVMDTGENAQVGVPGYFDCGGVDGWVNKTILRFDIRPEQEIGVQLKALGLNPQRVRWLVLSHLHIDHVDGLSWFPEAEVLLARREWEQPYGALPCLLPPWFKPRLVDYPQHDPHFERCFPLTRDGSIRLVPSTGHSHGHQSMLLQAGGKQWFFAGDTSFNQQQLLRQQVAGISINKQAAKNTLRRILESCRAQATVYLPSHDPEAGNRLKNQGIVPIN